MLRYFKNAQSLDLAVSGLDNCAHLPIVEWSEKYALRVRVRRCSSVIGARAE